MSRLRESASTLAALAVVAALVSGFGVGAVAFLEEQGTDGVRAELAARSGADLALQASLGPAPNAEQQDTEVRAAIANSLDPSGVHFDVTRTLAGDIRVEQVSDEVSVERALAMTIPDLEGRAEVDGSLPERETEVAVQADAASALGISVGDTVLLDGAKFTVTGVWRPSSPTDPRWYGDSMVATGFTDQYGPFVIVERAWSRLQADPKVSWTVVPSDIDEFTSTNLAPVIDAWSRIQTDWRGQVSDLQAFGVKRGLSETLAALGARLEGQRAIEPVIFTLLGALALMTLSEVTGLLVAMRSRESVLYWSRGRSPARIALRAAADVAVVAALGAAIGCVAVLLAAPSLGFGAELGRLGPGAAVIPAAVVVASVALAALRSYRSTVAETRTTRGGRVDARARRIALPGVVILAVLGAGLSVWQLRLYGSPITPSAGGTGSVDPIAVVAPAAALVALVIALAAVLPAIARLGERAIRTAAPPLRLAARALTLNPARFTAPLVVVALAVGGSTVAAAYASTWSTAYDAASDFRVGADVHVVSPLDGISPAAQAGVREVVGPDSVAPLDSQPLLLGSVTGTIMAVTPDALERLSVTVGGLFDPDAAADAIRTAPPGPTLPEGASALGLTISARGLSVPPRLTAHLVDPAGFLSVVELGAPVIEPAANGGSTLTYTADLPAASSAPLTVLGVDLAFDLEDFEAQSASVRLLGLTARVDDREETIELGKFWIASSPGSQGYPADGDGTGLGVIVPDDNLRARLVPSLDGTEFDRFHPPVIISQQLADLVGAKAGDSLSFPLREGVARLECVVSQVVPAIPGAASEVAVLMDLAVVQHYQLRSSEVPSDPGDLWIASTSPQEVREAVRPLLPAGARVETRDDPAARQVLGSPRTVLWAAAASFVILALIAAASTLRARTRWGRNDVATLRALGLSAADQRAIPLAEFSAVLVLGLLWGLAAGAIVALLTVPQVVRAAVPQRYLAIGTSISWDVAGLLALVAALVVGLVAALLLMARAVSAVAATAKPGEQDQ